MNIMAKQLTTEEISDLAEQQGGALVLFAGQWTSSDAEDIVQNAFIHLIRQNSVRGRPENPVAWLYRTVRNEAISRWRSEKQRKVREREQTAILSPLTSFGESTFSAEDLNRGMDLLDREKREIVFMRIFGNLSFDEIVETIGRPRTTVYRLYQQALESLKSTLNDQK